MGVTWKMLSKPYRPHLSVPSVPWCSCTAARHLVENRLGGTVDSKWMGDVHIADIYEQLKNPGGPPIG
jgi:fumarate reductase flavoprotein subunit